MTTLVLVRHGETLANVNQVWQGALDAPLTARGMRQVRATAQRMAEIAECHPIDCFYVSPLPRARSTAAAIAAAIHSQPVVERDLREFDLGDWEGRTFRDLKEKERLWERWHKDPTFAPPNGESPRSFGQRAVAIAQHLADRHPGQTILIVTHGGVICNVLASWLGDGPHDWRRWEPHNCAITMLRRTEAGWQGVLVNDTSHLPPDALFEEDKSVYAVTEADV